MTSIFKKAVIYQKESIKPLLLTTNIQLQNVYAPNLLQLPSTEKMIKFVNRCKTWMFTTYIDVDLNKDEIDIDFSKYPNLMNGICMTNFKCDNNICDLSTYHFIKYVRVIGTVFCLDCSDLTEIDLSPLSHVTSIGSHFLADCRDLMEIDLSPLSHVTSIGYDFLGYCRSLTEIDLSFLSHVTSIDSYFLIDCTI